MKHKGRKQLTCTKGWIKDIVENLAYAFLGLVLAFLLYQGLGFGLSTDLPVVAVVSSSMEHDASVQANHYRWLEDRLSYTESFISSWPITGGFLVGDMPIVMGSSEYDVGDVVVYSVSGSKAPIIHRIIKINEDGTFQTKGDNNPSQLPYESSVKLDQIHGKVIFIVPKLGYFKVILTNVLGVWW